jgi:hypothetical protein
MNKVFKKSILFCLLSFLFLNCIKENSPNLHSILMLIDNSKKINDSSEYETWTGCTISILKNNNVIGYFCIKENYQDCKKESFIDIETENIQNSIVSNLDIHDLNFPICSSAIDLVRSKVLELNPPDSFYAKQSIPDFSSNLGSVSLWEDCSKVVNQRRSFISILDKTNRPDVHNWKMLLSLHGDPTLNCLNTIGLTLTEMNYYQLITKGKLSYGIKYNSIY